MPKTSDFATRIKKTLHELEEEIDRLDEESKDLSGKLRDGMIDGIEKLREFMNGGAKQLNELDKMEGVDENVRKAIQDNMTFIIDALRKLLTHLQTLLKAAKAAQKKASSNDNDTVH